MRCRRSAEKPTSSGFAVGAAAAIGHVSTATTSTARAPDDIILRMVSSLGANDTPLWESAEGAEVRINRRNGETEIGRRTPRRHPHEQEVDECGRRRGATSFVLRSSVSLVKSVTSAPPLPHRDAALNSITFPSGSQT